MIAGVFGVMWTLWGASGLDEQAALIVRIVGIVIGAALIAGSIRAVRRIPGTAASGSMFSDTRYRIVVVAEVVAIVAGGMLLNATGNPQYVCPWVAFVVGAHFLLFGRIFWAGFTLLGAALVGAAVLGTILGVVTGDRGTVIATTALVSAAAMFASGGAPSSRRRGRRSDDLRVIVVAARWISVARRWST
jgi:hypothetical protein